VSSAFLLVANLFGVRTPPAPGLIKLNGVAINTWNAVIVGSTGTSNQYADVTSIVAALINPLPAGTINILYEELVSFSVDGAVLVVVFHDPAETTTNSVNLYFGAQDPLGDNFELNFGAPIDKSIPDLVLTLSLGISFGFQPSTQFSIVNVNNQRLSTSAGGQDDGEPTDGALLTVGGLGDTTANPANPFQDGSLSDRYDDELYNLLSFVNNGDTSASVFTQNPSQNDNIFFAGIFTKGIRIIVAASPSPSPVKVPVCASSGCSISFQGQVGEMCLKQSTPDTPMQLCPNTPGANHLLKNGVTINTCNVNGDGTGLRKSQIYNPDTGVWVNLQSASLHPTLFKAIQSSATHQTFQVGDAHIVESFEDEASSLVHIRTWCSQGQFGSENVNSFAPENCFCYAFELND
jgi:hypothetical protein